MKLLISLIACLTFAQAINECKQYLTCPTCLNVNATLIGTNPPDVGRVDCGWCHVNIKYANETEGVQCADVRDDPWNCGDQFDTATCSPGWACDEKSGQCIAANAGDGFGSKSKCEDYCGGHKPQATYRCNTTSSVCDTCTKDDKGCNPDRAAECTNCIPDPSKLYRCNKTDPDQPKCEECDAKNATDCHQRAVACNSCAPKPKLFSCDKKTFTCKPANTTGTIKQVCDATCQKITPIELLGTWRGIESKKGEPKMFDMGEIDLIFADKNLTVKYPNRTQNVYDVATDGGDSLILTKGNETIRVVHNVLAYLKHTTAAGLTTFGPGKDAPDSFKAGFSSNDAMSLTMWKCNAWGGKGTCDFSNTTAPAVPVAVPAVKGENDKCNEYGDCHTCIGASTGDVNCGWCLGGTLSYEGIGVTPYKCGGFAKGSPYNFTCPADFRTTDCQGYSCDWSTKQCTQSVDGQFPDEPSCHEFCTKEITHAKCNTDTKKCEKCTQGDKDCNTAAFCSATCGKPHAKCDPASGKCSTCEPGADKDCTQTKPACDSECSVMPLSKCDRETGKCHSCPGGAGCVPTAACENTCSKGPDPKEPWKCSWNTTTPKCVQDKTGTQTKEECTQSCQEPAFGKCNFTNNTCVKCNHTGDAQCIQTMDYCKAAQKEGRCKAQNLTGLFRMIEAQPSYDKGEFDALFKDGKMYLQEYETNVTAKDLGTIKATGQAEGGGVTFEVTGWKPEPKIWNHDKLFGVYKKSFGESNIFTFLELAFSETAITKLDDGLKGRYFLGAECADKKICDFSKATPDELRKTSQYAKYKFFMG